LDGIELALGIVGKKIQEARVDARSIVDLRTLKAVRELASGI
jgi:hypothetical protein